MRLIVAMLLVGCAVAHAGPAPDQIAAYRALVQQDLRLATVGHRLASANATFCKRLERNPGWVLHDEQQYPDRDIARAALTFRRPIAISAVVPGGAADRLGLKVGDGLVAINDVALAADTGMSDRSSAKRIEDTQNALRKTLAADGAVRLTLETVAGRKQMTLKPTAICASRFWVDTRSKLDAGADGNDVRITEGLMTFTKGDDAELAAAVAHELAHNLLGHRARLKTGRRSAKAVLATEIEADRLSVWLMVNAGYDHAAALRFAERYGRKTGLGIFSAGTHLRWKNRVKVMQAEIGSMRATEMQGGLLPPPLLRND